jgi:hypothetical protein
MSNNKTFRMSNNMLEHQCAVPTVNENQNWIWHHRYIRTRCLIYRVAQVNSSPSNLYLMTLKIETKIVDKTFEYVSNYWLKW